MVGGTENGSHGRADSKSSPRGDDVPVRRACLPSMLSMVEYLSQYEYLKVSLGRCLSTHIQIPAAKLTNSHDGALMDTLITSRNDSESEDVPVLSSQDHTARAIQRFQ